MLILMRMVLFHFLLDYKNYRMLPFEKKTTSYGLLGGYTQHHKINLKVRNGICPCLFMSSNVWIDDENRDPRCDELFGLAPHKLCHGVPSSAIYYMQYHISIKKHNIHLNFVVEKELVRLKRNLELSWICSKFLAWMIFFK